VTQTFGRSCVFLAQQISEKLNCMAYEYYLDSRTRSRIRGVSTLKQARQPPRNMEYLTTTSATKRTADELTLCPYDTEIRQHTHAHTMTFPILFCMQNCESLYRLLGVCDQALYGKGATATTRVSPRTNFYLHIDLQYLPNRLCIIW